MVLGTAIVDGHLAGVLAVALFFAGVWVKGPPGRDADAERVPERVPGVSAAREADHPPAVLDTNAARSAPRGKSSSVSRWSKSGASRREKRSAARAELLTVDCRLSLRQLHRHRVAQRPHHDLVLRRQVLELDHVLAVPEVDLLLVTHD